MTTGPRFREDPGGHFFLFGPRGTGKSTWLRTTFPRATWVDLLDPDEERTLSARPETLRERVEGALERVMVIDEVQRAPAILTVVHQLIEEKKRGRRFVLTGSSARKLRRAGVDLLGGRASMHPFVAGRARA